MHSGRPKQRSCLDWGSFAYWRLFGYAQGDTNYDGVWEPFVPYPCEATRYQECVDILREVTMEPPKDPHSDVPELLDVRVSLASGDELRFLGGSGGNSKNHGRQFYGQF